MTAHRANRRSLLAKIHIAKKDLSMDDDIYRGLLMELFGVESASKLKITDLVKLCTHFEKIGWQSKPPRKKQAPGKERQSMLKKIWAICYDLGLPVPDYANGLAQKMFKVDRVDWCKPDQLHKIAAALSYHQKRKTGGYGA